MLAAKRERAELRKQRLSDIRREQNVEDTLALSWLRGEHDILYQTFKTVKAEFTDLDGLSWPRPPNRFPSQNKKDPTVDSPNPPFAILSAADLASFAPEETIRASRCQKRRMIPWLSPRIRSPSLIERHVADATSESHPSPTTPSPTTVAASRQHAPSVPYAL